MSEFLVVSSLQSGHFNPATAIVKNLASRRHEVGRYTGKRYQAKAEAPGARFFARVYSPDFAVCPFSRGTAGSRRHHGRQYRYLRHNSLAGVGINLHTETPTPAQIRGAVLKVLYAASPRGNLDK